MEGPVAEGVVPYPGAYGVTGGESTASLALLAEACGSVGQIEEGLQEIAQALAIANRSGGSQWSAELYRLQGELLLRRSAGAQERGSEPEACFHQALAIARRQQAKSWELRTALSLSRLWQLQGKRAEAHQLLAEVYGWFTEGFDTPDVQEARALLENLGT